MKQIFFTLLLLFVTVMPSAAQTMPKFGYADCDSLLRLLPEYTAARTQVDILRKKYQAEAEYNERTFKREFAEFLQGQKTFTENILLKRQRDLQYALQKNLRFRQEADSIIAEAETALLRPARACLSYLLKTVGEERGYEYILDTSRGALPYVNPFVGEDCTPYVRQKIGR